MINTPKTSVVVPTMNRAKDVVNCVESILKSSYSNLEIIVVDNASTDDSPKILKDKYNNHPKIKLIFSKENLGAGGGRNLGAKKAVGEYILFVDSDNVIDKQMISNLVEFFTSKKNCGMVGPLMLYKNNPKLIWTYFADINMHTSQAKYKGFGEKDLKQYEEIVPVGHLPNCFMVSAKDFKKIGGFDEKYFIVYEEADLAEAIKQKLNKQIFLYTKAKTYHNVDLPSEDEKKSFGFRTPLRAFLMARNRIYFMKKNASLKQKLSFFLVFNPLIILYYQFNLVRTGQLAKAGAYLKGSLVGIFF